MSVVGYILSRNIQSQITIVFPYKCGTPCFSYGQLNVACFPVSRISWLCLYDAYAEGQKTLNIVYCATQQWLPGI